MNTSLQIPQMSCLRSSYSAHRTSPLRRAFFILTPPALPPTFVLTNDRFGGEQLKLKPPDSIFDDGGFVFLRDGQKTNRRIAYLRYRRYIMPELGGYTPLFVVTVLMRHWFAIQFSIYSGISQSRKASDYGQCHQSSAT